VSRRPVDPLAALPNLGPKSAEMLRAVGVTSPDELRRVGASMAYHILRHRFPGVDVLFLYALEGAIAGRHWNSFSAGEKARLKAEADGDLEVGTVHDDAA
jgi:DNA transformation protein